MSLTTIDDGFSFFLRDVSKEYPVYVAEYKTIVTDGDDRRSFDAIVQEIESGNRRSKLEEYACAEEESFDSAAKVTRGAEVRDPGWASAVTYGYSRSAPG